MSQFPVSSPGDGPSYIGDFELAAASNPRFGFPAQADSKMPLLPFSPSFSPVSLHSRLESDRIFSASGSDASGYWIDQHNYNNDQILQSPQWSSIPAQSQDLWAAIPPPGFDIPQTASPYPTYHIPSTLPRLLPRASSGRLSPFSVFTSSSCSSRRSSLDSTASDPSSIKRCSHCAATATPLWRRNPATQQPLCNACGLYLQQRNKMRPRALIAAEQEDDDAAEDAANGAPGEPECSHCHTHRTSVWRRSKTGAKLCNACGVYARLRGRDRPLTLRKNKIKPRCKHTPK
ncbi:hypothetical protein C8R43DRAFT_1043390 [Mycena crocata]|nr:hypothetical protein C8R43DRAFT_1043390 [Mycena crocata]